MTAAQTTPTLTTDMKKAYRKDFLKSCCDNFVLRMQANHKIAYYDPCVPSDLAGAYYDDLLPEIRAELVGGHNEDPEPHPVDRHKIAAATAHLILALQPMRDAYQLQNSGTYDGEPCSQMNSQFAIYTSVAVLDQWRSLSGKSKLVVTERAKRFIREHVKLMTKCHAYPIFAAAQSFYLFEELCLAEAKLAGSPICHKRDCSERLTG